jgi:hypothetical protein
MRSTVFASLVLLTIAAACGDDPESEGGGGSAGATGEGGDGGQFPGCPVGSHETTPGVCEASLGAFVETSSLTDSRDHHMTFAAKRASGTYLYAAGGGRDMTESVYSIERAAIQPDGSLGPWTMLATECKTGGAAVASTDDVVIFAGGFRPLKPSSRIVDIFTIDDAGELVGPVEGPSLNVARFHGAGVLVNGWFYAAGGMDQSGTSSDTVERAKLDGTTLGSWVLDTPMTDRRSHQGLATDGKFLFASGGLERIDGDFANDTERLDVLRAPINEDGSLGAWQSVATTPVPISVHASFVHAGSLYLIGGLDNVETHFLKTMYRAPIASDGSLGAWEQLASETPLARGHTHQTPIVDGVLYSVGGHDHMESQVETFFARFE